MENDATEIVGAFTDAAQWDAVNKTVISVRDGVLEYLGSELGIEPPDKTFTVFRSPATIANVANAMSQIPLTDEHVEVGSDVLAPVGKVVDAEMIDLIDAETGSKLAIKNSVQVEDFFLDSLAQGGRELSLGYNARLIPHDEFDFEQRDIDPHHLAIVEVGRCGPVCRFVDHSKKEKDTVAKKLHKVFNDQEGSPNLEQIVEIAQALPDALRKMPVDKLQEMLPMLQEIVAVGKGVSEGALEDVDTEEEEIVDAGGLGEPPKPRNEDEDMKDADKEEKVAVKDSVEFKDAMVKAVDSAVSKHTDVLVKAKEFVAEDYVFADKSTIQIMRDAVATIHDKEEFSDEELPVAFKMLKTPASNLSQFGDSAKGGRFATVADKEL
jgi:hypothetical protein